MSRKSVLLGIGILVFLVSGVAGTLVLLVRHEPDFYRKTSLPPGEVRQKKSLEFVKELTDVISEIHGDQPTWRASFTEEQVNSYFDEDFIRSRVDETMLPAGFAAPRVAFEPEMIRLAFRYGKGAWSSIISIDLHVWTTPEPNVVAVELQGLHAGSLPITAQSLLERFTEVADRQNIKLTWYRLKGNPVALLRFQADKDHPTFQLQWLNVKQGKLEFGGCSGEASPLSAMLAPSSLRPAGN